MNTKHYYQKKLTYLLFGPKYYHKIKVNKILFDYLIGRDYDEIYKYLSKIFKKNAIVLDVGANMGQCLTRFSKIFKEGKIISVEPLPVNVDALYYIKRVLRISNSVIIRKAISRSIGSTIISIPIFNGIPITTQASLLDDHSINCSKKEKVEVETTTIDELVYSLNLEKVDYIKIDTEGFDAVVLDSGVNTIKKYKPLIRIETNCFDPALNWLFDYGYSAFKFHDSKVVPITTESDNIRYIGDTFFATEEKLKEIIRTFQN